MRRNFSILSLLLFVSLAAASSAWLMERNRFDDAIATLGQKQKRLERYEGQLKISDPSKAHAVAVEDLVISPRLHWTWNVYLPSDKKYRLNWSDFDIPADGIIKAEHNDPKRNYGSKTEYSGELLVEFSVDTDFNGRWWMSLAADRQGITTGPWPYWNKADTELPRSSDKFPLNFKFHNHSLLPKHGTQTFEGDVLLLHAIYPKAEWKSNQRPGCASGFAVWLEELAETSANDSTTEPNGR